MKPTGWPAGIKWKWTSGLRRPDHGPACLQPEPQENGAGRGLAGIRTRALEAHALVHLERGGHHRHGISEYFAIARAARFGDHPVQQRAAQPPPAKLRPHIQPLGFTAFSVETAQRDTPGRLAIRERQPQPAARRRVFARQMRGFLAEVLEAWREAK